MNPSVPISDVVPEPEKRGPMWRTFLAALAMVACWACSAVAEKEDVEIGVLICALGEPDEALASNASSGRQTRDALCTFKPKNTS